MMVYQIYQVKREKMREFGFLPFEHLDGGPDLENYDLVYVFDAYPFDGAEATLEDIYYIFNMQRPEDFHGHSLSVGDIVRNDDGFWYCDSFGWRRVFN